jgi:diguanylate cyclase (GGDEF)-like protein/PAS domain S-box-containing protein
MRDKFRWSKTIRAQLTFGFGTILLLNCVSAAIGYGSLQRLRNSSQTTLENAAQVRELSLELNNHFLLARQAEENYLNNWQNSNIRQQDKDFIAANQASLFQVRNCLEKLRSLNTYTPELSDDLELLDSLFNNYESAFSTTVSRINQGGSRYQIHQQLQQELNNLVVNTNQEAQQLIPQLIKELALNEKAYFDTGNQQYISDIRTSLDRLKQLQSTMELAPTNTNLNGLTQNYINNLNALLLLDQQVRVNRIIAANIHHEINRIIQDIVADSAGKTAEARLELAKTAQQSSAALLVTAITALALTVWASLWLGQRIMIPLTELSEAAESIAQGNLNQTLDIPGDDEFSRVARAFNKMVHQLRQTLATLEQRVTERTKELALTNKTLQSQTKFLESAMQRLHHSEANYRLLLDHLQAGVVVHAPDTNIVMCNQMASKLLGMAPEQMQGQTDSAFVQVLIDETGLELPLEQYPVNRVIATKVPLQNQVVGIRHSSQKILWVLVNAFPTFDNKAQLSQVVVTFTDITDHKVAEEALRFRALHDALTGLPNRALLLERLNHALQQTKRYPNSLFAVLFIDLDRFKIINDSLGHTIGDHLLVQVADTLLVYVRSSDTVARLGGDEFVILLEQINNLQEAIHVAERIQSDMKSPLNLMGQTIFTSASIGIAVSDSNYTSGEEILRDADNAMYRAKAKGQAVYEVFNPEMHQSAIQLFELETNLRQAIKQQDFTLHYQPIVCIENNQLLGFEALVRWQHPELGIISPNQFIPLAEETGLIVPLSEWIVQEACRQMATWVAKFPTAATLKMSVNIAARQFQTPHFLEMLDQVLRETPLAANHLKLEVTERLLLANVDIVLSTLESLKQRGIEISIDDFGTGYSSLSYLKRFPIHTLKIDKSFVDNLDGKHSDDSIVKAIIQIAHSLGMAVIAEGVETPIQRERLQKLGCGAIQGYLIAPPLAADQAEAFIEQYFGV